ncbi:MAG: hypothetical protein AAFP78_09895 [Pseudomonadota bacterium]
MSWFAIEQLSDAADAPFDEDAFIGQARLEEDDTFTFMFRSVPPRGARVRLVEIPNVAPDYWEDCPPEIDFDGEVDADVHRAVRNMKGGSR